MGPARSTGPALSCPLREDVRIFLHQWKQCGSSPTVEKVTAHDSMAIQAGDVRACGNDHADRLAKAAAASHLTPEVYARDPRFADAAVRVRDSHGGWVTDLAPAITAFWWSATRRAWLAQLFPAGMAIEWEPSVVIFRPPVVAKGEFVHVVVAPPVLKWVTRVRCGGLWWIGLWWITTHARLTRTRLLLSPRCSMLGAEAGGWLNELVHAYVAMIPTTGYWGLPSPSGSAPPHHRAGLHY